MKKLFKLLTVTLLLAVCFSSFVACGKSLTKEEVVYKMICYVAEENEVDVADVTVKSGEVEEQEDGDYFAWVIVSVNGYTRYFSGKYYVETETVTYLDVTIAASIPPGVGEGFYSTDSFDIDEVNDMLQGN